MNRNPYKIIVTLIIALILAIYPLSFVSARPAVTLNVLPTGLVFDDAGKFGTVGEYYIECAFGWENVGATGLYITYGPTTDSDLYICTVSVPRKIRSNTGTFHLQIPVGDLNTPYTITTSLTNAKGTMTKPPPVTNNITPQDLTDKTTLLKPLDEHFSSAAMPTGWNPFSTPSPPVGPLPFFNVVGGPGLPMNAGGSTPYELLISYWPVTEQNVQYGMTTCSIDASNATTHISLSFRHMHVVIYDLMHPYHLAVEVSTDNGTSWTTIQNFGVITANIDAKSEVIDLDGFNVRGKVFQIRFLAYGFCGYLGGWWIDDVVVSGY